MEADVHSEGLALAGAFDGGDELGGPSYCCGLFFFFFDFGLEVCWGGFPGAGAGGGEAEGVVEGGHWRPPQQEPRECPGGDHGATVGRSLWLVG